MAFSQLRRLRRRHFTANLAVFPQAAEGFLIFYSCHLKRVTEARGEEEREPLLIYLTAYGAHAAYAFYLLSCRILRIFYVGHFHIFTLFSFWPQTKRNEQLMRVKMLPQLAQPDSRSLTLSPFDGCEELESRPQGKILVHQSKYVGRVQGLS